MNQLTCSYTGIQLQNVVEDSMGNASAGFIDGNIHTSTGLNDYTYDAFGNMTIDNNKKITNIKYNHLNLPTEIVFEGISKKINYTYNAAGVKVIKNAFLGLNDLNELQTSSTLYLGGYQYNNDVLQFFPHAQGYVRHNVNPNKYEPEYDYVYQYKDHLGNIRINYTFDLETSSLKVLEENHYYPFGLKHTDAMVRKDIFFEKEAEEDEEWLKKISIVSDSKFGVVVPNSGYQYKYNGKEWQDELGLAMYAMDMRMYDPAIARWVVKDPVVHYDFSPYSAFDNNPVYWADPSGADSQTDMFGRSRFDKWGVYIPPSERKDNAEDSYIDKIAVKSLKETAKLYIDGVDLSNLSESGKQKIFETDEIGTIGILLWEFATGTGKGTRKFEVGVHPFANRLMDGRILSEIIDEFNVEAQKDGYDFAKAGNSSTYKIALEFSPNKNPQSWLESISKHIDSNPVQFFVGGAIAKVRIEANNLMIQIYNETSRNSLMLHIGDSYDRKDGVKPLSTIKQYINASYELIKK